MTCPIRLIDLGLAPYEQTQSVYHAVAELATGDTPDTIILCRPASRYVSLGFHQRVDSVVDRAACEKLHIPILHRHVGGGLTLLDPDQLFYQCIFHKSRVPAFFGAAFAQMLQAPIQTLRCLGLDAHLAHVNEVEVGGKRIAGTGGGQIEETSVVVGNLIFDFDYGTMSQVWKVPTEGFRELAVAALRRHLTTLYALLGRTRGIKMSTVQDILVGEFERVLGRPLEFGTLARAEQTRSREIARQLESLDRIDRASMHARRNTAPLKIAAQVFCHYGEHEIDGNLVRGSFCVRNGIIEDVFLEPRCEALEGRFRGSKFVDQEEPSNQREFAVVLAEAQG